MDLNEKSFQDHGKIENGSPTPSPPTPPGRYDAKATEILEACEWKDVEKLRALATSDGGLVSDEIRQKSWPLLLGYFPESTVKTEDDAKEEGSVKKEDGEELTNWEELPRHRDEDQVRLDVDRSFIFYPNNQTASSLTRRKEELSNLITEVLRRQPYLSYFQGYHDICQVFLLVLDATPSVPAITHLSTLRIRDFMLPTFSQALTQLRLIPQIIAKENPALCTHLSSTQPFFALSGTLTMYAHDIQEYSSIARLFDVLLAREAVFSVYMFAQIVLSRSSELFEIPDDEPEMLHSMLAKLPKPLDIEALISKTVILFDKYPPETLKIWKEISRNSVLKTARWRDEITEQTIGDGERYFQKQVKELKWAERKERFMKKAWKYRRPVGTIAVTVLVGLLSFYIGKNMGPSGHFGALFRYLKGYKGH